MKTLQLLFLSCVALATNSLAQTAGQFELRKYNSGGGMTSFWITPENSKAFGLNGSGVPAMLAVGGSSTLAGLSDVAISGLADLDLLQYDAGTSKWNNVPSSGFQPSNANLTNISALTTAAYGLSVLETANAVALRTLAGLGTAATATIATAVTNNAVPTIHFAAGTPDRAITGFNASGKISFTTPTGTGSPVWSISPTLTTPNLGTPSTLTLTNATGLPLSGLLQGGATAGQTLAWNGTAWAPATISGTGDALTSGTLDQFANVTQTGGATLAIGASTTLSGGTHSGTNTGDQDLSAYLTSSTAATTYAPIANPTFTGLVTVPGADGLRINAGGGIGAIEFYSSGLSRTKLQAGTFSGVKTVTLPATTGTLITTGDTGTVTAGMLADSYQPADTQLTSLAGLSYTGNTLKVLRVNAGETGFELATVSGVGDALTSGTLDQFANVTQTAGQTLAITSSTTLSGGTHSGTNTGDQTSVTGNAGTATAALGIKTATTTVVVDSATAPTSGQVLTATSSTAANWQTPSGGGGGSGTKTIGIFAPRDNQPPSADYATLDTRNSVSTLDFDDGATNESAVFVGVIPEAAVLTSGIKVRIKWTATSATSGACRWGAQWEREGTDIDSDSFDTATEAHTTTSGTSGIISTTEITCTAIDSLAAGEAFRLKIYRDSSDGTNDTMTGDAELIVVEIQTAN